MLTPKIFIILLTFLIGFFAGAYLFQDTKSRPIFNLQPCKTNCYTQQEVLGLVTSVIILKTPDFIPEVVLETNKAIAITNPVPESPIHYLIFPKKDIKNIAEVTSDDQEYLTDMFSIISKLVEKDNLEKYQVITNGPGYQHTSFLHFHLRAEGKNR